MRRNSINSSAGFAVAGFISENNNVKMFDLEHNNLSDVDVPHYLVDALKRNSNLSMFDIKENGLSKGGKFNLMDAVFDTNSLNEVVASNHTCQLDIGSDGSRRKGSINSFLLTMGMGSNYCVVPFEADMKKVNGMPQDAAKIQYKVLEAVCNGLDDDGNDGEEVNMVFLAGVPLKLMPRVLALVQKRIDIGEPFRLLFSSRDHFTALIHSHHHEFPKEALRGMYCILKGWEMPVLFENGGRSSMKLALVDDSNSSARPRRSRRKKRKIDSTSTESGRSIL